MVFEGVSRSISVTPKYCSKIKHKSSPCTICYSLCPTGAIEVGGPGETINVEWDSCTGCGICVSQCPAQVFKLRHGGYRKFIDNLSRSISPRGDLVITCSDNPSYNRQTALVDCAGIFSVVDFLVLYLRGASRITVKYGLCMECASKHGKTILEQEIKLLEQLKNIFEDLNNLETIYENDSIRIIFPKQLPIIQPKEEEKPNPTVNRRGMFAFLKNTLQESILKSADMITVEKLDERTKIDFSHEETARRKTFIESIMSLGKITQLEVDTNILFNNIVIDETCVYCGMCARFCNTGALYINEERNMITFNPSKCISCKLCEKACYHNKLHYLDKLNLKNFFKDNVLVSRNSENVTISDMKTFNV